MAHAPVPVKSWRQVAYIGVGLFTVYTSWVHAGRNYNIRIKGRGEQQKSAHH
jgi:hypothetical protein